MTLYRSECKGTYGYDELQLDREGVKLINGVTGLNITGQKLPCDVSLNSKELEYKRKVYHRFSAFFFILGVCAKIALTRNVDGTIMAVVCIEAAFKHPVAAEVGLGLFISVE